MSVPPARGAIAPVPTGVAAGKPAPTLRAAPPGRLALLRDFGWLVAELARAAPRPFLLWAALALAQGLLVPAQLWLTRALVDALAVQLRGGEARGTFLWLGLLAASLLAERALGGLQPWLVASVREAAGAAFQERVLGKAAALDLAAFEQQRYYDELDRVIADVEPRTGRLLQQLLLGVETLPPFLGYAVALGALTPLLPLIVLAAVLPAVAGFAASGMSHWRLLGEQTRERRLADYYARLLTDRQFAKEVRLYGLAGYLHGQWARRFRETRAAQRRLALRQGVRQRAIVFATVAVSMLGLWWVGAARLLHATAGGYALLFQALQGMIGTTFTLSTVAQAVGDHAGYASAFRAFSRQPEEPAATPVPTEGSPAAWSAAAPPTTAATSSVSGRRANGQATATELAAVPSRPFPQPLRVGVRFEDVWFTYPGGDRPVLASVSFQLGAGEKLALVGVNGAGKTTLAKLLLGLYRPDQGRITVDGVDARAVDPRAWREAMSAVFQQFARYPLSVAENTALAAPAGMADRERLLAALARAGAGDVAGTLNGGLDAVLGPEAGGGDLSGGQWQRLALARACFREAQVLVLDEPTAALDPLAELALFERFAAFARGKATLLISHRLGMARLADRVLVLAAGRLVEVGTHAALLGAGGAYARLFEAQARWYR